MDKKEFLDILRQSLNGEVSSEVIEQNIKYYDHYISSRISENGYGVFEEIGDPRLIAKTIIESNRAARQKEKYTGNTEKSYRYHNEEQGEEEYTQNDEYRKTSGFNFHLNWKQKLTLIFTILVLIFIVIIVGRVIIGFLFAFGVPILLALLLLAMFRKRN